MEDKKEKEDRRCFKCDDPNHFISDYPKHSYNDQKAFVVRCWSDSEEDFKKEENFLMALDNNEEEGLGKTVFNSPKDSLYPTSIDDASTLWHRRLGHTNIRLIQLLSSKELVRNLPKLKFKSHFCDACNIGKQVHASHKAKNMVWTTKCLELLHMDLFGPSAVQSYGGNFYTLVIVDDYSRYTWARFLKHKTEAFDHFEILSKKIQVKKGCPIISICTDHGREFDNEVKFEAFCDANGITHNFSAPRTQQSNRVVERKNRTLQEMSKTMLNEQSIPQKFWCNAATPPPIS
ncbi:retrovirus-related pol polyprotein from transposon TNT 1-94 [Tanacetum coccineum]